MDITRVLVWSLSDAIEPSRDCQILPLGRAELEPYLMRSEYELDEQILASIDGHNVVCIGALVDDELAGYMFLCTAPVNPDRNSGGKIYTGIGLEFNERTRYLYKVLVVPSFRGKGIASNMMRFAARHFYSQSIACIVTTTDWTNSAFLRSTKSVGFIQTGTAGEFVVFGKHYYRIPAEFRLNNDPQHTIRFVSPA